MACTNCDSGGGDCGGGCECDASERIEKFNVQSGQRVCIKCKVEVGALAVGNQHDPWCKSCLHTSLLSKFRTAVNNNGLVLPSDRVLVAFSGGPSSRAALELLKEIQLKAKSDAIAAKDRGLKVFGLGAVFVDERIVLQLLPSEAQAGVNAIRKIFADGSQESIPLHVVGLQSVFDNLPKDSLRAHGKSEKGNNSESNGNEESAGIAEQNLVELFQSVEDSTGKEDLLEFMRMRAIQQVAQDHGYTKVVLGLCCTHIAGRVIADTTKGRGYSLSADIQYLDARWAVPVVLPLRDCVARELALFCHFSKFETVFVKGLTTLKGSRSSLNSLAHSFITLLQEENPSREHTIVRTAAKLKFFKFNEVDEHLNRRRRNPQSSDEETSQSKPSFQNDVFCPICCAPLKRDDILECREICSSAEKLEERIETHRNVHSEALEFWKTCCPSCRFQIFPEEEKDEKYGLLPREMKDRGIANIEKRQSWMRTQVESYLLPEEPGD